MAAATAVAVRQLGRVAHKLHLGLDLELMFYGKLATQRGQGIMGVRVGGSTRTDSKHGLHLLGAIPLG